MSTEKDTSNWNDGNYCNPGLIMNPDSGRGSSQSMILVFLILQ